MIDRLSQNKAKANISNVPQLQFQASDRQSKKLVEFAQVAKAFENKTLYKDLSFNLSRGNVLGVLGANGSGKSTLLKLILDQLKPDSGKVWVSEHARIAYFDQMRSTLDLNDTLKTSLAPDSDSVVFQNNAIHVITWAKRFGFDSKQLGTKVGELSGGEKARLCLAKLMLMHADILLLDEPTNDLDIESLEALEDAINSFPAAIILISHDRYLLNNVCDIFLGLVPNQGALQFADYEQWAQAVDNQQDNKKSNNFKKEREQSKPNKLSYNEQRELQNIEKSILKAENKLEALTQATSEIKEGISPDDLQKVFKEMADAQAEVDLLYQRWEELEILSKSFAR
jgi:ATP-binding cassette subfamily F protein uup